RTWRRWPSSALTRSTSTMGQSFAVIAKKLRRHLSCQRAFRLDLAAQPERRRVITVRPGRRTVFEEDARKIVRVAQRLDHRAGSGDDGSEVVLACHAVAESCAETVATEAFEFCDLDHNVISRDASFPLNAKTA